MATTYDSLIIGAGLNGLTAAAYLARAGQRVLVLERRDVLGGFAATEEIAPAWKSMRISRAALAPGAPMIPPPGWVPEPHI